jgi:2-amino-4-hydroxy-6-hydroxymethyldihydropteridine diphosphokinase
MIETETAYLGLGSNLGDRKNFLDDAVSALDQIDGITVRRRSRDYDTAPEGPNGDMPRFLNEVVEIETTLSPSALLERTEHVERQLGRDAKGQNKSRRIDIDILLYGERIIDSRRLHVPHPRLHGRAFALVPLAELAASRKHPKLNTTIAQLAAAVSYQDIKPYHD